MPLEDFVKHVALDKVGEVTISTVYLGLDHSFGQGPPLYYETMVFGGPLDGSQERYTTVEEAQTGHAAWVDRVKEGTGKEGK